MDSSGNVPTPDLMASFRVIDAWLADRGWTQKDRITWRSERRGRVTLATHEMAVRIQRRRDKAIDYRSKL